MAKAAYQKNKDPLDAAVFYLAMKKKNVLWGLFRSSNDDKMTTFFRNNFNEDRLVSIHDYKSLCIAMCFIFHSILFQDGEKLR